MLNVSAYWDCDEARYVDMHMAALTPKRYQRAMLQLSREMNRPSNAHFFKSAAANQNTLSDESSNALSKIKQGRTRIQKMHKGFQPYRQLVKKTDDYAITANQSSDDAAYVSAIVQQNQRLANKRASTTEKKRWAALPATRKQARMMQQLGLRFDQDNERNKPVSQMWIRNTMSQLHGLSLLLELDNRQTGKSNVWGTLPKREFFKNDPQWVRAIATVILLS